VTAANGLRCELCQASSYTSDWQQRVKPGGAVGVRLRALSRPAGTRRRKVRAWKHQSVKAWLNSGVFFPHRSLHAPSSAPHCSGGSLLTITSPPQPIICRLRLPFRHDNATGKM
jgi:hypothetical protein